jgi:hypothetical protein
VLLDAALAVTGGLPDAAAASTAHSKVFTPQIAGDAIAYARFAPRRRYDRRGLRLYGGTPFAAARICGVGRATLRICFSKKPALLHRPKTRRVH